MEASAIKQIRVGGTPRARTPLLRMQSDERLVTLVRRGNQAAFGALVSRYEARLLAFCRHLVRSREDAEDVLQDVFASAFKAMIADNRPIKVRPWLYRIARNRCLNHLRRISAIGVDSIEEHCHDHSPSTSDAAQRREDLWQLVGDIQELPESQRSALLLREMEALSYEQIAEVMDRTIPSVKSLLIRARRSLAEAAEARTLTCEEAMTELGEVFEGRRERPARVVRRHLGKCVRCAALPRPEQNHAGVRAWLPLGPLYVLKKLTFSSFLHSARAGSTATAAGAGAGVAAAPSLGGGSAAGMLAASIGGIAGKAAVGLTAAALGVGGAVVVDNDSLTHHVAPAKPVAQVSRHAAVGASPARLVHDVMTTRTAKPAVTGTGRTTTASPATSASATSTKTTAKAKPASTRKPATTTATPTDAVHTDATPTVPSTGTTGGAAPADQGSGTTNTAPPTTTPGATTTSGATPAPADGTPSTATGTPATTSPRTPTTTTGAPPTTTSGTSPGSQNAPETAAADPSASAS